MVGVCSLGLTGCVARKGTAPLPGWTRSTYTSALYHFAVSYDAAAFRVQTHRYSSGFVVELHGRGNSVVAVTAIPLPEKLAAQTLSQWRKGALGPASRNPWVMYADDANPRPWAVINGVHGIRSIYQSGDQITLYDALISGSDLYLIHAVAAASDWASTAPELEAVVHTFRVTKQL
jgi:hypothetical protein